MEDHRKSAVHPDAKLLALCTQLSEMEEEWQRLYDATSNGGPLTTPEDRAWQDYGNTVWPALTPSRSDDVQLDPADVHGQLRLIAATTPEDRPAKGQPILAPEEAVSNYDLRYNSTQTLHSLVHDVAGITSHDLGADAGSAANCPGQP